MKAFLRGSGLWELSLGLALILAVAGAIVVPLGKVAACARGQRTLADMSAILQACRQYDALHGSWPASWGALQEVLPQAAAVNVWGYPFVLASAADRVWVETDVPAGSVSRSLKGVAVVVYPLSGKDHVRLSANRGAGQADRLVYEKRNVYGF